MVTVLAALGAVLPGHGAIAAFTARPGLAALDATRDRPLFTPSRRPPPAAPASLATPDVSLQAPPPPRAPDWQLSGVIVGPEHTFAVVKRLADAKILSLEVGREIDGWTVTAIRSRELDVRHGDQAATMKLAPN